jgi:cyanophycin synthetase
MNLKTYLKSVTNPRKLNLLKKAIEAGIKVELISEKHRILRLSYKKTVKYLSNEEIYLNKKPGTLFTKNKDATKLILSEHGISVPRGTIAQTYKEALVNIKKFRLAYPLIIKPIDAAKGLGVIVGIKDSGQLFKSINQLCLVFKKNKSLSTLFIIEEMISGNDFRILILNGKFLACAQRVPAYIIGDGKSSISSLIKTFNKKRPVAFKLKLDSEVTKIIKEKGYTTKSTPGKGVRVQLRKNANISSGGRSIDKTHEISTRFKKIGEKCAQILDLRLAGVDLMTENISSKKLPQPYYVIEVNGAPQHDIHEKPIVMGKGVGVTKILVKNLMGI